MGITEDAMKLAVYLTVGLTLFAATWAVSTETDSYAEMAALETDNEWSPKAKVPGAQELISEKAGPSPAETRFDDGSDINNPTSLFPGPVYGLPGYKESHDWLNDLDWWSPLVFDWRYYKARCAEGCNDGDALKDMGEGAVKKYWLESGMDNMDVGSPTFNCEYYVKANKELHDELTDDEGNVKCKSAVKQFLTEGVFDGLSGSSYDGKVFNEGPGKKTHWVPYEHMCLGGCEPGTIKWDKNYAWTFWFLRTGEGSGATQPGTSNAEFLPVFAVRPKEVGQSGGSGLGHRQWGWWGGYPFFMTWRGRLMFCGANQRWYCQWPIGEENSGIKGGWRFNWWSRWRLPPINHWRFYGLMVDETGYTLYEYSDPPLIGYDNLNSLPYGHDHWASKIPPSTHGFARKVNMKSKGSWWGWDIHDVYSRADSTWNPTEHPSADVLPEDCTLVDICHP